MTNLKENYVSIYIRAPELAAVYCNVVENYGGEPFGFVSEDGNTWLICKYRGPLVAKEFAKIVISSMHEKYDYIDTAEYGYTSMDLDC